MKMPDEWKPAFEGAETVSEVLSRAGLAEKRDVVRSEAPEWDHKMQLWIMAGLGRPRTGRRASMDKVTDAINDSLRQGDFLSDDERKARNKELLLLDLERNLQAIGAPEILFHDGDYGDAPITVRAAAKSSRLWQRALNEINRHSVSLRNAADLGIECLRIALEINARAQWEE